MNYQQRCSPRASLTTILSFFLLVSIFSASHAAFAGQKDVLRVGLAENKPMCYIDANGQPAGIFVSVIEYVAAQESWELIYVRDKFSALRTQLEKGEIDVLLSTAVSASRIKLYSYNNTDVFNNWAEVFITPKSKINSLLALQNKRIATLEKGIYSTGPEGIMRLNERFNLNCTFLPVADYKSTLEVVRDGQADAAVVNRLVGATYAEEYGLIKSGIVFAPVAIRFAFNKQNSATSSRIKAVDHHLADLISDPGSTYHQAINKAIGGVPASTQAIFSSKIRLILYIASLSIFSLFLLIFFLRWQIKRQTRHLSEVNAFNKQIIESAQEGIVVYGLDLRFQSWNSLMERFTGKKADELIGKRSEEAFPFFKNTPFTTALVRASQGESRPAVDFPYDIPETGKKGWASVIHSPLKDSHDQIIGVISTIREISKQKQSEATIKKNEQTLRNLLESTSTIPWELDLTSQEFTYMGKQIEEVLGYPAKSWKDMDKWAERIHPQDRDDAVSFCTIETRKGSNHDLVYRATHQDGSFRWIRDIVTVIMEDNEPKALVGFMHDITEEKAMAVEKENLEIRFKTMIEKSPLPMVITDHNQDVSFFNDKFTELFGYSLKDISTAEEWWTAAYPDENYRQKVQNSWAKAIEKAVAQKTDIAMQEWNLTIKDRTQRRCEFYMVPLGEVSLIIVNDISERKQAEAEKEQLESRLQQAQKMEAIGTLAGGIAHDFNNILAVILGYADMAKEDAPPGTQFEKDLEQVVTAAHRAKSLVQQILAFSRQAEVKRIPIKIQPLIKEGLKMLRSSIPSTISITEDIEPKSRTILADPTQIHQILMNLCTNAYHTMEQFGGILSVTIKTTFIGADDTEMLSHVNQGEYVKFTVSDTGTGIDPDTLKRIFDPYFTTKKVGKGTGMGLAIIHGIMKNYGGTITVESQLGKGSSFHVYFPVIEEDSLSKLEESEDIGGIERILFIDDEELLAEMGRDMLERLGYQVTVRRSSLEALSTFQNSPDTFDLVITDQTMPDMTGSDLSRRMMQIRPDIPIILCTGYSTIMSEEKAKAMGIKEFVLKPLSKKDISILIRKILAENKTLNSGHTP